MPYRPEDAHQHDHRVPPGSGKTARQWSDVFNETLKRTHDEGKAFREASGVIKRGHAGVGGTAGGSDDDWPPEAA